MFGHYLLTFCNVSKDRLSYVWGTRNNETHGWLQYDRWIVDLTPDQFEDETRAVIVCDAMESSWHNTFEDQTAYEFGLARGHVFRQVSEEIGKGLREKAI